MLDLILILILLNGLLSIGMIIRIVKATMKQYILFFLIFLLGVSGCDSLEFSPNQAFDKNTPRDLNNKNLEELFAAPSDDTVRFVVAGDTQRQYKNTRDLVNTINRMPGIDMFFLAGDVSEFGLLEEMEQINELLEKLSIPYITVVGNHDFVGNGDEVFKRMFGKLNFSFVYQGTKFICHNTNSREFNFNGRVPNVNWLAEEFLPEPGVDNYVAIAHVLPLSWDFDTSLTDQYINIINGNPKTRAAFYAHDHRYSVHYPHNQDIPYVVTNALINREFLLVEIINGTLSYKNIKY